MSTGLAPAAPEGAATVGAHGARRPYLDNLKVVLVSCVIIGHAFITYGDIGSWVYREPSTSEAFGMVAVVFVSIGSLFVMGLFFLIAGLLTPGPLRRKGPRQFLADRLLRLGVPFALYAVLLYPLCLWLGEGQGSPGAYLRAAWTDLDPGLDPGPLWFVGVLLLFSTGYVVWRAVRPGVAAPAAPPLRAGVLVGLGAGIAAGSMLVRLEFPMNSGQLFAAHVWQWPQCLGLFVLGVVAAERGWLSPVSARQRRAGGAVALLGAVTLMAAIATAAGPEPFSGGATWQAALTASCEGGIAVGLSVWLLGTFQRHLDRSGPLRAALGRAAYGAYLLQLPVLLGWALLLRGLSAPAEAKFLILAPAGVATCFALSWVLTRVPGVSRVL